MGHTIQDRQTRRFLAPLSRQLRRWVDRATAMVGGGRCYLGDLRVPAPSGGAVEHPQRLALFPSGGQDVASARLRSLPFLSLMEERSVRSIRDTARLLRDPPDIAWIQKRLTAGHLRVARLVKESGGVVIYDCDDSGPDLDYWAPPALVEEMLLLADVVTTDTPERGERLREIVPSFQVRVLENQMDYADQLVHEDPPLASGGGDGLRVLWFGGGENLDSLEAYGAVLGSVEGVRLVLCGPSASDARRVFGRLPAEIRRWSPEGFIEILRSCDVTLMSHFGSRHHTAKSAHKMVTSICHGVPALVSATPDYRRIAALAGVMEDAAFASPEDLRERLERMKSEEVRRAYIARSRPELLARHGPGTFPAAAASLLRQLAAGSAS